MEVLLSCRTRSKSLHSPHIQPHMLINSNRRLRSEEKKMAFRGVATSCWRSLNGKRSFATGAAHAGHGRVKSGIEIKGEFAPVYVMLGMVVVAMTMGTHTAKQQLAHSPGVYVSKKRRESVPEVEDPDMIIGAADKLINESFLRKVAHIQEPYSTLHDPVHPDPFTRRRTAETLKTVGVDPRRL